MVDDDEAVRAALVDLLESAGYDSMEFGSAEDFLDALPQRRPDGAVLDMQLPKLDGLGLLQELRSRGLRLPVLFLSAHDSPHWREAAQHLGALAYLIKPARGDDVIQALQRGLVTQAGFA